MRNINTWRVVYNITVFLSTGNPPPRADDSPSFFSVGPRFRICRPRERHPIVSPSFEKTDVDTSTILCSDEDGFALLNAAGCFDIHGLYSGCVGSCHYYNGNLREMYTYIIIITI